MRRFGRVMSWRSISSGDPCMKMGTYHKTKGIIGLMIEELLPKVSRFRCKRNECAINHAKTGSPGMTGHALHPVSCFSLLICIGPSNRLVMEQQKSLDHAT